MPDILGYGDGTRLKPLRVSNRNSADGSYGMGCAVPYGIQRLRQCRPFVSAMWCGASLRRGCMARQHIIRLDLVCVVFLGGCVGTALRYACSNIPDYGAFHIGTFAANMVACFVYATLSAWLGGTHRVSGRAKEYVNRGFGMGMCGGLSTMSTLALEEFVMLHGGRTLDCMAYCCATFIVGCALAYVGALVGSRIADSERDDRRDASDGEVGR